jgi:hypothetical protein
MAHAILIAGNIASKSPYIITEINTMDAPIKQHIGIVLSKLNPSVAIPRAQIRRHLFYGENIMWGDNNAECPVFIRLKICCGNHKIILLYMPKIRIQEVSSEAIGADMAAAAAADDADNLKKKRGRKPKDKFKFDNAISLDDQLTNNDEDNIIVKFPISCAQLSQEFILPDIIPQAYDRDYSRERAVESANTDQHFCSGCYNKITGNGHSDSESASAGPAPLRQIDIILNNKYGCNNDKIQALAKLHIPVDDTGRNIWPNTVSTACYRCCHVFVNTPWGIPMKYADGKFFMTGIFCSPNCALGYILYEIRTDESTWEYIALLHMLYYYVFGTYVNIMPSPDKICLKLFGGSLDIDNYRKITEDNYKSYTVEFPPCNIIIPMLEEIYKKNNLFSSFLPNDKNGQAVSAADKTTKTYKLQRYNQMAPRATPLDKLCF